MNHEIFIFGYSTTLFKLIGCVLSILSLNTILCIGHIKIDAVRSRNDLKRLNQLNHFRISKDGTEKYYTFNGDNRYKFIDISDNRHLPDKRFKKTSK